MAKLKAIRFASSFFSIQTGTTANAPLLNSKNLGGNSQNFFRSIFELTNLNLFERGLFLKITTLIT